MPEIEFSFDRLKKFVMVPNLSKFSLNAFKMVSNLSDIEFKKI